MPLIQYTRGFLLSRKWSFGSDFSALTNINITLDFLTKEGKHAIEWSRAIKERNVNVCQLKYKIYLSRYFLLSKRWHNWHTVDVSILININPTSEFLTKEGKHAIEWSRITKTTANLPQISKIKKYFSREFLLSKRWHTVRPSVLSNISPTSEFLTKEGRKQVEMSQMKKKINAKQTSKSLRKSNLSLLKNAVNQIYMNAGDPESNKVLANGCPLISSPSSVPSNHQLSSTSESDNMIEEKLKKKYEKQIHDLKQKHFKELSEVKTKVQYDFEKTLGVANNILSIDKDDTKRKLALLQEKVDEKEEERKAAHDLSNHLKKMLEEKENEIKLNKMLADEEKEEMRQEHEKMIALNAIVVNEEKDKATRALLQVLENELECAICSEIFIEASILTTCAHAFCRHCIIECANNKINAGNQVTCPMCRHPYDKNNIRPFPLGVSVITKIEDKLPADILTRRQGILAERRRRKKTRNRKPNAANAQ